MIIIILIYIALNKNELSNNSLRALQIIHYYYPGYARLPEGAHGKQGRFLPVPIYYTWVERDNCESDALSRGIRT